MTRFALALVLAVGCGGHPKAAATTELPNAVAVGATAPAVQLTSTSGSPVAFADVLHRNAQTVVVFYRGFY